MTLNSNNLVLAARKTAERKTKGLPRGKVISKGNGAAALQALANALVLVKGLAVALDRRGISAHRL